MNVRVFDAQFSTSINYLQKLQSFPQNSNWTVVLLLKWIVHQLLFSV